MSSVSQTKNRSLFTHDTCRDSFENGMTWLVGYQINIQCWMYHLTHTRINGIKNASINNLKVNSLIEPGLYHFIKRLCWRKHVCSRAHSRVVSTIHYIYFIGILTMSTWVKVPCRLSGYNNYIANIAQLLRQVTSNE